MHITVRESAYTPRSPHLPVDPRYNIFQREDILKNIFNYVHPKKLTELTNWRQFCDPEFHVYPHTSKITMLLAKFLITFVPTLCA